MLADAAPKPTVQAEPEAQPVVFIPAQPVVKPVVKPVVVQPPVQTVSADLPQPEVSGGTLYSVTATQANVRLGPGTGFDVVDSLAKGEQVLVVADEAPVEGWSKIRIEGDGIEGYVATRLLVQVD